MVTKQSYITPTTIHHARPINIENAQSFGTRNGSSDQGSVLSHNPSQSKMQAQFCRINMPNNFYKVEKRTYTRGDISEIGNKIGKKLDEMDK